MRTTIATCERQSLPARLQDTATDTWRIVRFLGWLIIVGAAGSLGAAVSAATDTAIGYHSRHKAGAHR